MTVLRHIVILVIVIVIVSSMIFHNIKLTEFNHNIK